MSFLHGKTILLISPAIWGPMRVSKHHYAAALASRGNRVFFLEPPDRAVRGVSIAKVPDIPGLEIVSYRAMTPQRLRFHARKVFDHLMRRDIRRLLRAIQIPIDIVWSFEPNLYSDLRDFGASLAIYHPVDAVLERSQLAIAETADVALTVADPIAARLRRRNAKTFKIGHGLADPFVVNAKELLADIDNVTEKSIDSVTPRVGYIGNLMIPSLDRVILRTLVEQNEGIVFEFWGPHADTSDPEQNEFARFLGRAKNVRLHGLQSPESIAARIREMDAFLVCYDPRRDPNGGSNAHKILEYLSSGKTVISTHVSEYAANSGLLEMLSPDDPQDALLRVFKSAMSRLSVLNSRDRMRSRLEFSLANRYETQLEKIEALLSRSSA